MIIRHAKAFIEPQRVQHELERQIGRADEGTLADPRRLVRGGEPSFARGGERLCLCEVVARSVWVWPFAGFAAEVRD